MDLMLNKWDYVIINLQVRYDSLDGVYKENIETHTNEANRK